MGSGTLKRLRLKQSVTWNSIPIFFLHSYDATLVAKKIFQQIASLKAHNFIFNLFSKLAAQALDVLAGVCLDFFHTSDFRSSDCSEEKVLGLGLLGVWYSSELELPVI